MASDNSNALWVALSEYGEGNIFHVYPTILADLLREEDEARQFRDYSEAERLVLPSDREWRCQQYFMLVGMQKEHELDPETENGEVRGSLKLFPESPEEWAPWNLVLKYKNANAPPPVQVNAPPGPAWDIAQVLKASKLLFKPPMEVKFIDEQDMRRVYALIYDVFRYKTILDQVIDDIQFFAHYTQYSEYRQLTWLFLMELARRGWGARMRGEKVFAERLLREAGSPFKEIEAAVWAKRVHFAAAVSRIRIKEKAFSLSDLLPAHLRDERVAACVNKETVTGWVNTFKTKKVAPLVKHLHDLGYSYSHSRQLCAGEYRFDRVCPRFITLRPPADTSIGMLDLVKNSVIVLQEREFCEGASTLCRALRTHSLRGAVAQTHASSPRCSAYLAAQLRELAAVVKAQAPAVPAQPELGRLVVFGAGDDVENYVCALRDLGVEAISASDRSSGSAMVRVLSEAVHCDTPQVASALDGVVAALATPPNSYSAVTDPIDLVCGRGGDITMLEILTEASVDLAGKARVQSILEEQKKTLKTLLSKPQIQMVLYETHSALEAENQAQVSRAVAEANRLARERHAFLKRKIHPSAKIKEQVIGEIVSESSLGQTASKSDLDKDQELEDSFEEESSKRPDTPTIPPDSSRPNSAPASRSRPQSALSTHRTKLSQECILKKQAPGADRASRPSTTKARPIPELNIPDSEIQAYPREFDKDGDIYVPNCDLFEVTNLPNLGNGLDINYILDRDGCYLSLIQRKEMTRLDAKYMIQVAEERGLFGTGVAAVPRRKRPETLSAGAPRRRRRKTQGFEVDRVAQPTYASMVRSARRAGSPDPAPTSAPRCERHARRLAAATAFAATCTCTARHRQKIRQRRASAEVSRPSDPPVDNSVPSCRQPFPLVVHDLCLHAISPPKIYTNQISTLRIASNFR